MTQLKSGLISEKLEIVVISNNNASFSLDMFNAWILLSPLLLGKSMHHFETFKANLCFNCDESKPVSLTALAGARAFMIHNTQRSLCLEDSAATGEVLLKRCNLDSESQQWIWIDGGMLMCVASSRCLSAMQREPVQTQSCSGSEVDAKALMWDCDRGRLISRNSSMLLSADGRHLILTHQTSDSKQSTWKSLDEGDICQDKLSKSVTIEGTQICSERCVLAGTECDYSIFVSKLSMLTVVLRPFTHTLFICYVHIRVCCMCY